MIYPVTALRLAMKAVENGLQSIMDSGTQADAVENMQTRAELYELLAYESYAKIDKDLFNFKID